MANPTLHLSVINNQETYNRRKHLALAHIEGALSSKDYRSLLRDIVCNIAANDKDRFGTKSTLSDIKAATDATMAHDTNHAWECFDYASKSPIHATIRRWRDNVNGNSYFTALVHVPCTDGATLGFVVPFQYGYGSHPEFTVWYTLIDKGILPDPGRYDNGNRKGYLSDAPIVFEDQGFMKKNQMFGR